MYNSGFKLVNLPRNNLDEYLRIRTKLRCNYERLIVEESGFAFLNGFDQKLWEECYEKPVGWIESHFEQQRQRNQAAHQQPQSTLHLRALRSLLVSFLDEGSTLFQLLLRCLADEKFSFNLSVYTAILLRKRENLNYSGLGIGSSCSRAFNLLQNAIIIEPFKGFGYFVMAQWTLKDNDPLLSIYWALTALNVKEPFPSALDFLKNVSREIVVSPSFLNVSSRSDLLNSQLLQMASHALLSLITGSSHLKHLDQLSHSQVSSAGAAFCDVKMLKYSCIIIWLIIGMFEKKSKDQISPFQSCLLAKLFQVHAEFILEPEIRKVFLAFSSNSKYSKLFSGNNYEILKKINNFAFESLNNLLMKLLKMERKLLRLDKEIYLDFIIYSTDNTDTMADTMDVSLLEPSPSSDIISLFLRIGLLSVSGDEVNLKSHHEKIERAERSVKLLTHQFLSTQLKSLESSIEPSHLPWTIPDYPSLLRHFARIKKLITNRQCKIVITLPVLQELDFDKNYKIECREIIRFLNELVEKSDPSLKILEARGGTEGSGGGNEFRSLRAKFEMEHVKSVKYFYENESKDVRIVISENENDYNFVAKCNLFKEIN